MIKKAFAAVAVAAALLFTGSAAAQAASYPAAIAVTASDITPAVGQPITLSASFDDPSQTQATFTVTPTSGASLSAIVRTAASVTAPVTNGVATSTFTASAPGTYTVTAATGTQSGSITITVAAAATAESGGSTLPNTGGEIPAAALWIGAGALGLGALAVVAATARRRAQQR